MRNLFIYLFFFCFFSFFSILKIVKLNVSFFQFFFFFEAFSFFFLFLFLSNASFDSLWAKIRRVKKHVRTRWKSCYYHGHEPGLTIIYAVKQSSGFTDSSPRPNNDFIFFFLFPLSSNNTIIRELIRGLLERKGWEEGWISVDVQRTWKVEEKNLLFFFFLRLATTFLFFPPTTVYLNIYRGKEKRG